MRIKVVTVGKTKVRHWQCADADYIERIKRYADFEEHFVKPAKQDAIKNDELVKRTEAAEISKKLATQDYVVALDPSGIEVTSEKFGRFFANRMLQGQSSFAFVVGGPLGLSKNLVRQANFVLSLSGMTFPHELAKVILLEQVYRALTIIRGEKYHK